MSTVYNESQLNHSHSGQKRKTRQDDMSDNRQRRQHNNPYYDNYQQYAPPVHTYQPNYGLDSDVVQRHNGNDHHHTYYDNDANQQQQYTERQQPAHMSHPPRTQPVRTDSQVPFNPQQQHRPSNNSLYKPPPANSNDPEQRRQFGAWLRERKHQQAVKRREYEQSQQHIPLKKKDECKFWLNGACKHGAKCRFEHIGTPQVKQELCRYVLNNKCQKGANCYYSHDITTVPCRFWHLYGRCKNMDSCPFIHGEVGDEVKLALASLNELAARRKRGEIITADEQRRLDDVAKELEKQEEIKKASIVEEPVDPFADSAF